jgi:CheY-like chemotaxis protein
MNSTIPFPKTAPVAFDAKAAPGASANSCGTCKKILVVDDSVLILKAVSLKLRSHGYQVFTATDGSDAVSTVRRERPDLILLDINFPPDVAHGGGVAWDGFLIMTWLRRMEEALHTPVIIITGSNSETTRDRCLKAGVSGYFQKPINPDELLATILKLIGNPAKEGSVVQTTTGKVVLFVDDENDWRYVASVYLKDAGFEVLSATNGAEALQKIQTVTPGVVLLDLNLPGESGLDVLKLLKAQRPNLRVVLFTGMDHDSEAIQGMLRLGAHQYLPKGTMGEMLKVVQSAFAA